MSFILQNEVFDSKFSMYTSMASSSVKPEISDEYRGYNWHDVVLPVTEQLELPFNQMAYEYCDSGKYLYLSKVKNLKEDNVLNYKRIKGKQLDNCIVRLIKDSVNYINSVGDSTKLDMISFLYNEKVTLMKEITNTIQSYSKHLNAGEDSKIINQCESVINFEISQIASRVHYFISITNGANIDSIINHALPIIVSEQIVAKDMGFNKMTPDFILPGKCAIGELKSFKHNVKDKSYKIAVAGYALAYEKTYRQNMNLGFVLHLDIDEQKTPFYYLDIFVISDLFRKLFIEKRNRMVSLIASKQEPPLATICPQSCNYLTICKPTNIDPSK